jgi:hypothetical protein
MQELELKLLKVQNSRNESFPGIMNQDREGETTQNQLSQAVVSTGCSAERVRNNLPQHVKGENLQLVKYKPERQRRYTSWIHQNTSTIVLIFQCKFPPESPAFLVV